MAYLSIRNLPAHLEKKVIAEARRRHTTKTAIVIECIDKAMAAPGAKPSLRARAGKLSKADHDALLASSAEQRSSFSERWSGGFELTDRDEPRARRLKAKYLL